MPNGGAAMAIASVPKAKFGVLVAARVDDAHHRRSLFRGEDIGHEFEKTSSGYCAGRKSLTIKPGFLSVFGVEWVRMENRPEMHNPLYSCGFQRDLGGARCRVRTRKASFIIKDLQPVPHN
jgi:hypothetical protein